ncbi:hypothetical protein N781_14375 [Pontibacillus halophilus JSM 076056 = DSM 19796]|uniref:Uncharacterized protein n=1 Tax=Pontibacillus halophilus JSM 076056 = DSM 19796 TaxID=1385510 RepID=A0A0A5G5T3_9BACI|nr:hypothetical protein N781_14375 [Pontibacillus halophilus JSM 076056 = DSM 19796]
MQGLDRRGNVLFGKTGEKNLDNLFIIAQINCCGGEEDG